jgi:hypothetical protein
MLYLNTGQPGHGKTLLTIEEVERIGREQNRPVFYSGITLLPTGPLLGNWIEHDPMKWYELPPNAIMVIDECQKTFRPRGTGSSVPKHEEELETHRHGGIDLYLLTQHPMFASTHVRRLTHEHRHIVRVYGMQVATVHTWNTCRDDCDKAGRREDSNAVKRSYPKHVYKWYKSAEVHTVKRSIPKRIIMLAILPFLLAACVWYMYWSVSKRVKGEEVGNITSNGQITQAAPRSGHRGQEKRYAYQDALQESKQWVYDHTPRVAGLEQTAPRFDELTRPTRVPVPAACLHTLNRCKCYTQQATPLDVGFNQCVEFARNGYFEEFDPNHGDGRSERSARSSEVLASQDRLPISGALSKDAPNYSQIAVVGLAPAQAAGVPDMPPASMLATRSEAQNRPRVAR